MQMAGFRPRGTTAGRLPLSARFAISRTTHNTQGQQKCEDYDTFCLVSA
jgi:hypothetical protein